MEKWWYIESHKFKAGIVNFCTQKEIKTIWALTQVDSNFYGILLYQIKGFQHGFPFPNADELFSQVEAECYCILTCSCVVTDKDYIIEEDI